MQDFITYAQFEGFWERFQPETPFGRSVKEAMTIHRNAVDLERIWNETEVALGMLSELEGDPARLSRISHHLKRIPRVPEAPRGLYDEVEIFQFKKFLHNYKSLVFLVNVDVRRAFAFDYASDALEELLDTGRQSPESFYIADAFSKELAEVRAEIQTVNTEIQALQHDRSEAIRTQWNLSFGDRPFLVVPRELLSDPAKAGALLLVEPFDETRFTVRPVPSGEELILLERRSALLAKERVCEGTVLAEISAAVNGEFERVQSYREAITRFDLAFARARMARDYQMVRPRFHGRSVAVTGGRFLPCEEVCRELGTTYLPLEVTLDASATVIFGSNMGGKTVALKTLAFLQLCAQAGLFVPAEAFSTRLFQHFHYLGEGCAKGEVRGLSGFGFEIRSFIEAWDSFSKSTLVIFDEFARTTNSREAEAILSAVVESVSRSETVTALFSTHFRGVSRLPEIQYLRMQGLDRRGLALGQDAAMTLAARIRIIDEHMEFRLIPDAEDAQVADAIVVAELLGLPSEIASRAKHYFKQDC
ncbi:MAG: hypothetical protein IPN59_06305 [Holophaga sp.]|nr:hypothetical protein [Holophaga sp.]